MAKGMPGLSSTDNPPKKGDKSERKTEYDVPIAEIFQKCFPETFARELSEQLEELSDKDSQTYLPGKDRYPLIPRIDDMVDQLQGPVIYSKKSESHEREHEEHLKHPKLLKEGDVVCKFSKCDFGSEGNQDSIGKNEENAFQLIKQKLCRGPNFGLYLKGSEDLVEYL
ncbi:hypothetical protein Tco_0018120 [Tanacetum coccineum]